ncbi:MAG: response regulator [Acidimicrobiia bacterium]
MSVDNAAPSEREDLRHIAHDLNNVLGTILNYAEIIERRVGDDPALLRAVRQTRSAVQKGALLSERLSEGSAPPALAATDLVNVVHGLAPIIVKRAGKTISVELHIDPGPIHVPVDAHDLAQLVLNLTTNSFEALQEFEEEKQEFEEEKRGRLEVEVRRVLRPLPRGGTALSGLLAISDNGHGMSAEVAARATEPFFTTREGAESWGLGLTLAGRVVKKCGGLMEIRSKERSSHDSSNHGTRVEVYLPTIGSGSMHEYPASGDLALEGGRGETVLVVDDDHDMRYLVGRILKDNGYRVVDAATPHEAVSVANETGTIDAVLTDVVMPSMPGTELADILQRRFGSALKVLFLSGFSGGGELRNGYRVVSKPYTERELLHRIRRVLDGPR